MSTRRDPSWVLGFWVWMLEESCGVLRWGYERARSHGQDGARAHAMQIVRSSRERSCGIEHISSVPDDTEPAALKEIANQRLNAGHLSLDLPGLNSPGRRHHRSGQGPLSGDHHRLVPQTPDRHRTVTIAGRALTAADTRPRRVSPASTTTLNEPSQVTPQ